MSPNKKNQVRPLRGLGRKHVGCSLRSDFTPHACAPYLKVMFQPEIVYGFEN